MRRAVLLALLLLPPAALLDAVPALAQEWRPPSREMPAMPRVAELRGEWLAGRAAWFDGVERVSGVTLTDLRAVGEPRAGSDVAQVVRVSRGPLPVVVWVDRNGDTRADLVEIYRSGGVVIQLIDADYDGSANVMRFYDAAGTLLRETQM